MTAASDSNLIELCERSCREHGPRSLFGLRLAGSWWWVAYAEFFPLLEAFRGGLASLGVGAGDTVAMLSGNRLEWAVACYATLGRGAAFVPMREEQSEQEWQFMLADSGARVAIGSSEAITGALRRIQPQIPTLSHVVGLELPGGDPHSYAALLDVGRRHPVAAATVAPDTTAEIVYVPSAGGTLNGVMLSHRNILSTVGAMRTLFALSPDARSLSLLPWADPFAQFCELHALLSSGSTIAINDSGRDLSANLADVEPTVLFVTPDLLDRLPAVYARPPHDAPHRVVIGNAPGTAAPAGERTEALGITVFNTYGSPKTSALVSANCPAHRRAGSAGKPVPHAAIEIDRSVTGDATRGEIIVRGPHVMHGLHNRPSDSSARTADGGLRTGDIGYLDADGFLFVTGRLGDSTPTIQPARSAAIRR